jgi:hypothetical protein
MRRSSDWSLDRRRRQERILAGLDSVFPQMSFYFLQAHLAALEYPGRQSSLHIRFFKNFQTCVFGLKNIIIDP